MSTADGDAFVTLHAGPHRTIVLYRTQDGQVPVQAFFAEYGDKVKARYYHKFHKMCEVGHLRPEEWRPLDTKGRKEVEGLSEFRDLSSQTRIISFNDGERGRLVLLYGFGGKKEDKTKPGEFMAANRNRTDYLTRDRAQRLPAVGSGYGRSKGRHG